MIYNYDGILIEYGIYDKDRENDYKGQKVNYLGKNGLRYTRYDFMKYQEKIINNNKYKDELLIKHPLICCNIHSKNIFSGLLEKMFFISKDSPLDKPLKPGFWLFEIISNDNANEKYKNQWENNKYNIFNYNCQVFVSKVIEALYATPAIPYHIFLSWKLDIPPIIYDCLEKMIEFTKSKPFIIENNIRDMFGDELFFEQIEHMEKNVKGKVKNPWKDKTNEEKQRILKNVNNNAKKLFGNFVENKNINNINNKKYNNNTKILAILTNNYYICVPEIHNESEMDEFLNSLKYEDISHLFKK